MHILETAAPFDLGVNYWPRRKAMYWWSNFDAGEVREEFALIRDLGMTKVRLFLLWDDWQPRPDMVSSECMHHFERVCAIASDSNLGLDVTFFTGHMSGPNWAPHWLLGEPHDPRITRYVVSGGQRVPPRYRSYYTDPVAWDAQKLLLRTVVGTFHQHPAIWMWNLGNEPDLFALAPDRATAQRWIVDMRDTIKAIDGGHPVTVGLHSGSLFASEAHRIDDAFGALDTAVMHSYPMYTGDLVDDPLDPDYVPFTCALTTALCGKPTLMEEFGGCMAHPGAPSQTWAWTAYGEPRTQFMASEEAMAEYLEACLPRLVEVGATGAFLWCYADYSAELWGKPPCDEAWHERFFGLVRPDGSLKPHAEVIRHFAATQPRVQPATRTVALDISPDAFYEEPAAHLVRLWRAYKGL
jgi:endo-1,4-beta-mannosidase